MYGVSDLVARGEVDGRREEVDALQHAKSLNTLS